MSDEGPVQTSRRILGRVAREEFVGRASELQRLVAHPAQTGEPRGLLLLLAPSAGVSELLRQAYDVIFNRREDTVPIYFAFTRNETTAVSAAIEFLTTFLQQYVAYRRDEPALCNASLTLSDLLQLAPSADYDWMRQLVESYEQQRFTNDDKALVRFCLSVPQRVPVRHGRPFVMLDGVQLAEQLNGSVSLGKEVLRAFTRGNLAFAMAGLRRQILNAAINARCDFDSLDTLRLDKLGQADASLLVEHVARRQHVTTTEETRDLLVQQFECSPLFITSFLQAARDSNASLTSYLACERLYVEELMGGRLHRQFALLLEEVAPEPQTRHTLVRILHEALSGEERRASFDGWCRRLNLEPGEVESILLGLHVQELLNWDGAFIEAGGGSRAWKDYLKVRYRLDTLSEPRALVVGDTIAESLKRAPHTMAQHYRRAAAFGLGDLLSRFDGQRIPESLFHFEEFSRKYKGVSPDEAATGVDAETALIRLPQVVHIATCAALSEDLQKVCDHERCIVAHSFAGGSYTDSNEVIWLVTEVESKLEVSADVTATWCERLEALARRAGFHRIQIWLISQEGFSTDAVKVLQGRSAYGSSRQQVELLSERLKAAVASGQGSLQAANEFLIVLPMGEDNELIAASAAEQIARRLSFRPEAINQIKTAVVEACINASEHSLSPDRKIYQRFRVENDRLVVTISSRGVVPATLGANKGRGTPIESLGAAGERRGWGLKLIETLMDEVEFERVDEGTSLKMTKYLRNSS